MRQLALPQQPLHLDNGSDFLRGDPDNGIDPSHIGHCLGRLVQMHILPYLVDVLLVLDLREVLDAFVVLGLLAEELQFLLMGVDSLVIDLELGLVFRGWGLTLFGAFGGVCVLLAHI